MSKLPGQASRPQPPHLGMPSHNHDHLETPDMTTIFMKTDELTKNIHFEHYLPIILDYLKADNDDWHTVVNIRLNIHSRLLRSYHSTVYDIPPPDIFSLLVQIRRDKSWNSMRQVVLTKVQNTRHRYSGSSWATSGTSGYSQLHGTLLTPASASTRSLSQESQFRLPPGPYHLQTGSGYQPSGSSGVADSPTPAEGHISSVNANRTAPEGYNFYCPSKNCRKSYPRQGYSRQGHYENHMQQCHAEWPPHNSWLSLRKIPGPEQPPAGNLGDRDMRAVLANAASTMTPQAIGSVPMPHASIPPSPEAFVDLPHPPDPETVYSDILESGTMPEVSFDTREPISATMSTPASQNVYDALSPTGWGLSDGQQQYFQTPLYLTHSNSNISHPSTDSYMKDQ